MTDPTRTVMNIPRLRDTLNRERKVAEDEGLYFFRMMMMMMIGLVFCHHDDTGRASVLVF